MLSLAELTLWLLTTLVEAFVVFLFLIQGLFRKFLLLNIYLLFSVTIAMARFAVLYYFGFTSSEYAYFYYFTDALLTICLFLSLCELSVRLVGTKMVRRKAVVWSAGALLATSWFSFLIVSSQGAHVTTRFVVELSQNIFFVCCLAIVLLWVWNLRNYPEDRIAAKFVNVLSVYFSLFMLMYGARQLAPQVSSFINNLAPIMGAWLPLGCGFALVSPEHH
jgi:hypothetical protein